MADIKAVLRERFAPMPAAITSPDLAGLLYVRRLKVGELRRYLDAAKGGAESSQALLLSMCVCDADGAPVFADPAEVEDLLGEQWLPLYNQAAALVFPEHAEKNSLRGTNPPSG